MQNPFLKKIHLDDLMILSGLDAVCFPQNPWKTEDFTSLTNVGGFGFVVGHDGFPIGFIFAQTVGDETEILRIATLPAFRRHGYADALLLALEKSVSKNHKIFLEVRAKNISAHNLYLKHGFEKIHERENYYQKPDDHAHVYVKKV
ncbi:MAG: GNAT family N-acetyltransferase [Alphaproteobacteria bacterium]|nr:GNAT family N-acetyltransferase [Alphaproteobacteria bacterium]